jgi:hypothetical protein
MGLLAFRSKLMQIFTELSQSFGNKLILSISSWNINPPELARMYYAYYIKTISRKWNHSQHSMPLAFIPAFNSSWIISDCVVLSAPANFESQARPRAEHGKP